MVAALRGGVGGGGGGEGAGAGSSMALPGVGAAVSERAGVLASEPAKRRRGERRGRMRRGRGLMSARSRRGTPPSKGAGGIAISPPHRLVAGAAGGRARERGGKGSVAMVGKVEEGTKCRVGGGRQKKKKRR